MPSAFIPLLALGLFFAFNSNETKANWEKYQIKKSKLLKDFILADSMMDEGKKVKIDEGLKDNRGHYKFQIDTSLILDQDILSQVDSFSLPCECWLSEDTINIYSGIGFYGGFGTFIQIYKGNFSSSFFHYIEGYTFKKNLSDTVETKTMLIENENQTLVLFSEPIVKLGERITGELNYDTPQYYLIQNSLENSKFKIAANLRFTCLIDRKQ